MKLAINIMQLVCISFVLFKSRPSIISRWIYSYFIQLFVANEETMHPFR